MTRYFCKLCDYEYLPEQGDPHFNIKLGTSFEDLPDEWECPLCGIKKSFFEKED